MKITLSNKITKIIESHFNKIKNDVIKEIIELVDNEMSCNEDNKKIKENVTNDLIGMNFDFSNDFNMNNDYDMNNDFNMNNDFYSMCYTNENGNDNGNENEDEDENEEHNKVIGDNDNDEDEEEVIPLLD